MSALASGNVYFKGITQHLLWDTEVYHDLGGGNSSFQAGFYLCYVIFLGPVSFPWQPIISVVENPNVMVFIIESWEHTILCRIFLID
jgi:hypothetical protein